MPSLKSWSRCAAACALLVSSAASAQLLRFYGDLRDGGSDAPSGVLQDLGAAGGFAFFNVGGDLFVTDGTTAGTRALADCQSRQGMSPVVPFSGGVFLRCGFDYRSTGSPQLTWRWTSGAPVASPVGALGVFTTTVSKPFAIGDVAFNPSPDPRSRFVGVSLATGDEVGSFVASVDGGGVHYDAFAVATGTKAALLDVSSDEGRWVWGTDGTQRGTERLDVLGESANLRAVPFGDRFLVFNGLLGAGLWKTDGTDAGTERIYPAPPLAPLFQVTGPFFAAHGQVFFAGQVAPEVKLWRTDGTTAGTYEVSSLDGGEPFLPESFVWHQGALFFTATTPSTGREVFRATGAPGDVQLAFETVPGPESAEPSQLSSSDGGLVFVASLDDAGTEPFVWTGTGSPSLLADVRRGDASSQPSLYSVSGGVVFSADDGARGRELWVTDGTVASTRQVAELGRTRQGLRDEYGGRVLSLGGGRIVLFGAARDRLLELPVDGQGDVEPVVFGDGGTVDPGAVAVAGGMIAIANLDGFGAEPYFFSSSTFWTRLADIVPGEGSSFPWGPLRLDAGAALVANVADGGRELWFSDGTVAGTRSLTGGLFTDVHPSVYVTASGEGVWLLMPDGDGGVEALRQLPSGAARRLRIPEGYALAGPCLVSLGEELQTAARDDGGYVLLRSDGTGSELRFFARMPDATLFGFEIGDRSYCSRAMGNLGIFFVERSVDAETDIAYEIWRTDGTDGGTFPLFTIDEARVRDGIGFTVVDDRRAFFVANDPAHGQELWVTDGTKAGTRRTKDLLPGRGDGVSRIVGAVEKQVLFLGRTPEHGEELFVSDGTESGTRLVHDVWPGPQSSLPEVSVSEGVLAVFADDGAHGRELWLGATDALDPSPPRITPIISAARNDQGVFTTDVTVTFIVEDEQSFLDSVTGCEPRSFTEDLAETILRCEATSAGGTSTSEVPVIRDATPPIITCPDQVELSRGEPLRYTASATDKIDPSPDIRYAPTLGTVLAVGTQKVRAVATDFAGNQSDCLVTVVVSNESANDGCGCGATATGVALFEALALAALASRRQPRRNRPAVPR